MKMGIGIGWPNASAGISYVKKLIKSFKVRVLSYSNSIFEAETCLDLTLVDLNAIGLLKQASLIVTPNAYNEGKLYDVVPNTTLGDMDVVRSTTATRVNTQGLIEVVPRNLFTYSEQYSNAIWIKLGTITVTDNSIISPSGVQNADTIFGANATSSISQVYGGATGTVYTNSFYIKNNNSTGSQLTIRNTVTALDALINWSGTTLTSITNIIGTTTFLSVGNGWYRVTSTYTSAESAQRPRLIPTRNTNESVYLWGSQLELGSTLTDYFPTTTGLNIPRIDYSNGSCPSLLVEPQRTNLFSYSQQLENPYWLKAATAGAAEPVITANDTISPNGNMDADKVVFSPITVLGQSSILYRPFTATNTSYSQSFYIKGLLGTEVIWIEYTKDGVSFISKICNLTTNWQRFSLSSLLTAGADNVIIGVDTRDLSQALRPAQTVFIWGAQLEVGSYPTSYIPTLASIVTRTTDVISNSNLISKGLIVNDYTLFLDITNPILGSQYILDSRDISSIRTGILRVEGTSASVTDITGGSSLTMTNTLVIGKNKMCLKRTGNVLSFFTNGIKLASTTTTTAGTINTLSTGVINSTAGSYINSVILFPLALTDAECINLTTI